MKHIVVTGCAGLIGSNLTLDLLNRGHQVYGIDNLITGQKQNIEELKNFPNFKFFEVDIRNREDLPEIDHIDAIYNLASPASPVDFKRIPLFILETASIGHRNMLDWARDKNARVLLTSTSEVYGDPKVHPQDETYLGNVNCIGPRGCYDEAKRYAEALSMAHHKEFNTNIAIARIFNTYGPRMRPQDGRVVPNFFLQGLKKEALTIFGEGTQTRSLCFVEDMVAGLIKLTESNVNTPVNIGNPREMTILEIADAINKVTGNTTPHRYLPLPKDDPLQRCPDISKAKADLGWEPQVLLEDGLQKTLSYFTENLELFNT